MVTKKGGMRKVCSEFTVTRNTLGRDSGNDMKGWSQGWRAESHEIALPQTSTVSLSNNYLMPFTATAPVSNQ